MSADRNEAAAVAIIRRLRDNGHVALLAGGCVRDRLLGRTPKDYDVATDATPERVVALFPRTRRVGIQFGVVLVQQLRTWVEVATFRSDVSYSDGRRPDAVVFGSAEEDALRRDFTINGMFFDPIDDALVDYVRGQADLKVRTIRAIGEPARRFAEDHLRMLRAVRLAAELEFTIEPATEQAIAAQASNISGVAMERVREELSRLLVSVGRADGFRKLAALHLLPKMMPKGEWSADAVERGVKRLEHLPAGAPFEVALAAALMHVNRTTARRVARALTCSNASIEMVDWLRAGVERLEREAVPTLAQLKRLMAGPDFGGLVALWRAVRQTNGEPADPCDALTDAAAAVSPESVSPAPFLTGHDLIEFGYAPGPLFSDVLERVYERQLDETINDRESAVAAALEILKEMQSQASAGGGAGDEPSDN